MTDSKAQSKPSIEINKGSKSSSPYSRPETATVKTKSGKSYTASIE